MRHLIIGLAVLAVPSAALAQGDTAEALPTRQTEIHNHTEVTISRLSLRRVAATPDIMVDEVMPGEPAPEEEIVWEDVLDESGAPQVLESHTHLTVNWVADECWVEFKAELSDGTAEYGNVDACNDTELQFGTQFAHE